MKYDQNIIANHGFYTKFKLPMKSKSGSNILGQLELSLTMKKTENLNNYFSATECPIDLKPGCKFEFIRCLEV